MGTSGAYKGGGGADGRDLRDAIADWLADLPTDLPPRDPAPDGDPSPVPTADPSTVLDPAVIGPAISIWQPAGARGSGGGGGGGGSGGGGGGRGGGSAGRGGIGGAQRSVRRVAGPAGRAGALARAYSLGNREVLRSVGLDYDALRALNDPLAVGQQIAGAAFDALPNSTLEDSEARLIVAKLIAWVLDAPEGQPPSPDDVVRQSIALMIEQAALVEAGATIRAEPNQAKRLETERQIHAASQIWASQVTLDTTGATSAEISVAIETGVSELVTIFGSDQ